MNHLIYIAHPIDQVCAPGEGYGRVAAVVRDARHALVAAGYDAYWPRQPWTLNGESGPDRGLAISIVNEAAQRVATATLALLPRGVPTMGVPVEIERALNWGQPVVIAVDAAEGCPVQVYDWQRRGAKLAFDVPTGLMHLGEPSKPTRGHKEASPAELLVQCSPGHEPKRHYDGDAGFDLTCSETTVVHCGEFKNLPMDCAAQFPPSMWGWIVGRSSTIRKGLLVNQGIIDNGWRGDLFVGVQNIGGHPVTVKSGDRLAQLIPMPLLARELAVRKVAVLDSTDRGTNGFGSTGD